MYPEIVSPEKIGSALSGFGELGETGLRPSAVGPGFYVELELSNRFFGQEMARQQMKGMGSLDPASTFINQYNPVAMLAQATQNVRLATLSGKNEGYMWEAQALNMVKAPIVATGSALVIMGAPILAGGGPMAPVGGAIVAAGTAVMMAGNSINVNPTTGERIMKATDQSLIATVVGGMTAFFGGSQIISGAGTVLAAGASSLVQSSVRYDSDGRSQGMSLTSWKGDQHGERAVLNATTAMITSAGGQYAQRNAAVGTDSFMGNAIWGDLISTGTNVLGEYGAQQTWGRQHSNYDALTRPDSGRFGSLAGAILTAQEQDRQAGEKLSALQAKQSAEIAQADKLAREGQKQQAIAILMAGGYFKDRRDAEAYADGVRKQAEREARDYGVDEAAFLAGGAQSLYNNSGDARAHSERFTRMANKFKEIMANKGTIRLEDIKRVLSENGLPPDQAVDWDLAQIQGGQLQQWGINDLQGRKLSALAAFAAGGSMRETKRAMRAMLPDGPADLEATLEKVLVEAYLTPDEELEVMRLYLSNPGATVEVVERSAIVRNAKGDRISWIDGTPGIGDALSPIDFVGGGFTARLGQGLWAAAMRNSLTRLATQGIETVANGVARATKWAAAPLMNGLKTIASKAMHSLGRTQSQVGEILAAQGSTRFSSVLEGNAFKPTERIRGLVEEFEKAQGRITPLNEFKVTRTAAGKEKQVLGGFWFTKEGPEILLFRGADEAIFVHEFVHFRQAVRAGIKDAESFAVWRDAQREVLEAQVDRVLKLLGYN